jgi:hypothetical protein
VGQIGIVRAPAVTPPAVSRTTPWMCVWMACTRRAEETAASRSPHHREDVLEGAEEAAEHVLERARVIGHRLRDEGMRQLEQRRAAAAEKDDGLPVARPHARRRSEDAVPRIAHGGPHPGEGSLEIVAIDRGHTSSCARTRLTRKRSTVSRAGRVR